MNNLPHYESILRSTRETVSNPINGGIDIREVVHEIRDFTLANYSQLDLNKDGFVSKRELEHAFNDSSISGEVRSFIKFLLVQINRIKYQEPGLCPADNIYISLSDIEQYFSRFE